VSTFRTTLHLAALLLAGDAAAAPPAFRFSPRPNRAAEIHWRAWDARPFADARAAGKPILLSLSAVWCHWCHVLDETTLSDPRVIALANRDFVALRVDADQHPDVERRYILGGWPTVALLTPDGEIIDGGTYVPPDRFLAMAEAARDAFRAGGPRLEALLRPHRGREGPARTGPVEMGIVEGVVRTLGLAADLQHGGFGEAPKFPNGDAVLLLLDVGEVELARAALDAMLKLEDPVAGGFFRYATRADWTVPHYEKMLAGNAELLEAYARGFAVTKQPRYRDAALRTARYLESTLLDGKSNELAASQDADESYYALDAAGRATRTPPYIDRTLLVDRAGRAVVALLAAARDLPADAAPLRALAARAAAPLRALQAPGGLFYHARRPGAAPEVPSLLGDQAWGALALAALGDRAAADRCLTAALTALAAPDGDLYDAPAGAVGLLRAREHPLDENAVFARALLAVGRRREAARLLAAFAGSYFLRGAQAAGYARAVAQLLEGGATGH
jgi:hypothetical protein